MRKQGNQIHVIVTTLSLLALAFVLALGSFYYQSSVRDALRQFRQDAEIRVDHATKLISAGLLKDADVVRAMAGMETFRRALLAPEDPQNITASNRLLTRFTNALDVDVCYLMTRSGTTIASSNHQAPDSFVGHNFSFRPYFRFHFKNSAQTYLARGTTSHKRGVYHSFPIRHDDENLGLVVLKRSIEEIEHQVSPGPQEKILVVDPVGVIFLSNVPEWRMRSIRVLSAQERDRLTVSRQFGKGPWTWIGLQYDQEQGTLVDPQGVTYRVFEKSLVGQPGWRVLYARLPAALSRAILGPVFAPMGRFISVLCIIAVLAVALIYRQANREIRRRRTAETALRAAEGALRRHSEELERNVRERTREILDILGNTPAVVYIKEVNGHYRFVNAQFEQLFGISSAEACHRSDFDIFPQTVARKLAHNDQRVIAERRACQIEEELPHLDGMHTYLSVKFPLFDSDNNITAVCCISTDITEVKKAQVELRRHSDGILARQENERATLARELHDVLGQDLTALRMAAVWIRGRLPNGSVEAIAHLDEMCALVDKTIENVRSLAYRLRPEILDDLGLVEALALFTTDFERRTGISCVFEHSGTAMHLKRVDTVTYRITQEALTNIARHADASRVDISLMTSADHLQLAVRDDGCGFTVDQIAEGGGLGVVGMRERASLVGGELVVESQQGAGTCVRFCVEIPACRLDEQQ